MKEYYILALDRSYGDLLCWWKKNNAGYTVYLDQAGKYSEDKIVANAVYYDNGEAMPILVEDVEKNSVMVVPHDMDGWGRGKVLEAMEKAKLKKGLR